MRDDTTMIGRRALVGGVLGSAALALGQQTRPAETGGIGLRFEVTAFGAKGDGRADDTAAAQAAIDAALAARGGRVHFPSGRYRITGTLRIVSAEHLDLTGDGWSSALLHERDEPLIEWPKGVSCREASVRHLRFFSTGVDKTLDTPVIACRGGLERSFFSHLFFHGDKRLGSGIVTDVVADTSTFDHCLMWQVAGTGIRVARGSEVRIFGGRIIGDRSFNPANVGIHLVGDNGGVHVVTTDLIHLHTCMKVGEPGRAANREIFVTHATFDSAKHGLWQIDSAYTSVAGCWAASCDEDQVLLDESADGAILSVAGGTIFNGGAYGRPGAHNGMVARAGTFTLSGVNVRHNKGTGLLVGPGARHFAVTGCRFHHNGVGARIDGERYALAGNVFHDNGTDLVERDPAGRGAGANVFDGGG